MGATSFAKVTRPSGAAWMRDDAGQTSRTPRAGPRIEIARRTPPLGTPCIAPSTRLFYRHPDVTGRPAARKTGHVLPLRLSQHRPIVGQRLHEVHPRLG